MAAAYVPPRGEPTFCEGECQHKDCAAWRAFFEDTCALCHEPFKEGQRYYQAAEANMHAVCEEKRVEQEARKASLREKHEAREPPLAVGQTWSSTRHGRTRLHTVEEELAPGRFAVRQNASGRRRTIGPRAPRGWVLTPF